MTQLISTKGFMLWKILFIVSVVGSFLFGKLGHLKCNTDVIYLNSKAWSLHVMTNILHCTLHSNVTWPCSDLSTKTHKLAIPVISWFFCVIGCNVEKQKSTDKRCKWNSCCNNLFVSCAELEIRTTLVSNMGHLVSLVCDQQGYQKIYEQEKHGIY